jgi:hypothetical protein
MDNKNRQDEPTQLTGLKQFIDQLSTGIKYKIALNRLNAGMLKDMQNPALESIVAEVDSLGNRMEELKQPNENVETQSKKYEPTMRDYLEGTGMTLPKGSKEKSKGISDEKKKALIKYFEEMSAGDRLKQLFRTDKSADYRFQDRLQEFNEDLDFRARNPQRNQTGDSPLNAEMQAALQKLIEQAKAGERS